MDDAIHNRAEERGEVSNNPASDKNPPEVGATSENIVTVCGWCPQINILKIQRRTTDMIAVVQQGKLLIITRNGHGLLVSHGICRECLRKHFPLEGEKS